MATLEENVKRAIADFDDIEAALVENGVDVPSGTDTSEYGNIIRRFLAESPSASSPVLYVESLDKENKLDLYSMESGTYILYGYFIPYPNAKTTLTFSKKMLVSISAGNLSTCVQVFYAPYNTIQYLNIWPDEESETGYSYERKDAKLYYMEDTRNKVTAIDETATEEQYPSAKAVYDFAKGTQPDWNQNDNTAVDYIKNRTHYTFPMDSSDGYWPLVTVQTADAGEGAYKVFTSASASHFKNGFGYDKMKKLNPCGFRYTYGGTVIKTGKEVTVDIPAQMLITNTLYNLIDTVNYTFPVLLCGNIYVILDVTALTDEYKSLFPDIGIYFIAAESQYYTNTWFTLSVDRIARISEAYIPFEIARTKDVPTDEHINGLINTALGVIENGSY